MSCCGNELVYNSVISEVVTSNLVEIVNLLHKFSSNFVAFGAIIIVGSLVLFTSRRSIKFHLE